MIRQARIEDTKQITKVVLDTWRTAYKGIVNDEYLANLDYEAKENSYKERILENNPEKFLYVFEDEETNQIVGFIYFGKPLEEVQYDGEVYAIYVMADYHKQGIGRQLMQTAINEFKDINYKNIIIWSLKGNLNARKFYEKMGGKLTLEKTEDIGGQILEKVAHVITNF